MNRRGFISMLTGAAGATVLSWRIPDPVIILPPRPAVGLFGSIAPYLTSKDDWFIQTGHPDGIALASTMHPTGPDAPMELSEAALESLLIDLQEHIVDRVEVFAIKPTRFIRPMRAFYGTSKG